MNFWDQTHPLSADAQRLFEQLVPGSGHCDTVQGECLRASSRIGYDWYNNGWGCNNWSGAVVWLRTRVAEIAQQRTAEETAEFMRALSSVDLFSHGERVYGMSDERIEQLVTIIHAYVVQCVLDNPVPIANTDDMLDLQERDAPYEPEEDEEDEDDY
jgi:hypothetical protein